MLKFKKMTVISLLAVGKVLSSPTPTIPDVLGLQEGPCLLPKSTQIQRAFLEREQDRVVYFTHLKKYIESQEGALDEADEIHAYVKSEIEGTPDGIKRIKGWVNGTLMALEENIKSFSTFLNLVSGADSTHKVLSAAYSLHASRNKYLMNRVHLRALGTHMPSTKEGGLTSLLALNRFAAHTAIDRHACFAESMKEAHKILSKQTPGEAEIFLRHVGKNTMVAKYMTGALKDVPDPDTCLEASDHTVSSLPVSQSIGSSLQTRALSHGASQTRQRLQRKLAQKSHGSVAHPKKPAQKPGPTDTSQKPMDKDTVAAIRSKVEKDREEASQRDALKARKMQEAIEHAKRVKERLHQLRSHASEQPPETFLMQSVSSSSHWTPPTPRVREKTRGVADPAYAQDVQLESSSSSSSSSSSQEAASPVLSVADVKGLETFWETKAGLTYHEIASLFSSLGGRISEKGGGSSHVTLSFPMEDGTHLKHELWRPHGKNNTFGFRTMAGLRGYFARCGLTLKD